MPTMTSAGYTPRKPEPKKAPRPNEPHTRKKKRRGLSGAVVFSLFFFAAAALVGAATLFVYLRTQPYTRTYCPGTSLAGYPLEGATQADAQELLRRTTQERLEGWRFTLTWGEQTYALTAGDIALTVDEQATLEPLWQAGRSGGMFSRYLQQLALRREPIDAGPVLTYDRAPIDALLSEIGGQMEREAVDASVTFVPGSSTPFRYTDEIMGYRMDLLPLADQIGQAALTLTSVQLELVPEEIEPLVTRGELERNVVLRTRVTMEVAADEASYQNVDKALSMLSGVRVEAGESLSFNGVIGRRAQEAGYVAAPEPAYGADAVGTGGGVCQASTALYQAALLSNLEIVERHAAVRPVPWCDAGQEAAVSDQGLDLVIRNDTSAALFILARAYRSDDAAYAQIDLIGAPMQERYVLESGIESLGVPQEPVYVRDSEGRYATYTDERVEGGAGLEGVRAEVDRVRLGEQDGEAARVRISEDVYEPVPPMIYVGIQARETTPDP